MTDLKIPVESTILYEKLSKSKPWSILYIALCELWDTKRFHFTAKDIEEMSQFRLSQDFCWRLLDTLHRMQSLDKVQKSGRDTFMLKANLFVHKGKLQDIANETIKVNKNVKG